MHTSINSSITLFLFKLFIYFNMIHIKLFGNSTVTNSDVNKMLLFLFTYITTAFPGSYFTELSLIME